MKRVLRAASARSSAAVGIRVLRDLGRGGRRCRSTGTKVLAAEATHPSRRKRARSGLADGDRVRRRGAAAARPGGLTRFIAQVTDKHSPLFHHYLTPGSFAARFGPTRSTIAAVKSQLQASGLSVTSVARDGLIVDFQAPASRVETAFRTGLERYRLANGSIGQARTAPVRVPATIAKYVTAVVGLDTTVRLRPSGVRPRAQVGAGDLPGREDGQELHPPGGLAHALRRCDGRGRGVRRPDRRPDRQRLRRVRPLRRRRHRLRPAHRRLRAGAVRDERPPDVRHLLFRLDAAAAMLGRVHTINVDGGQPAGPGSGEAILDIQDVSAFAPGANIDVYQAPNTTFGSIDEYAKIVNDNVDQIVTHELGPLRAGGAARRARHPAGREPHLPAGGSPGADGLLGRRRRGQQRLQRVLTTLAVDPVLSVDDPSSQPYVVGRRRHHDRQRHPACVRARLERRRRLGRGRRRHLRVVADADLAARLAGAGRRHPDGQPNALKRRPQAFRARVLRVRQPGRRGRGGCRQLPDVSADADEFTGGITVFIEQFGGWNTFGGTSSAAPLWAAMLADVNASATCQNNPATQNGVGFLNPLLYSVASNPTAYAASFNDIKVGNNDPYGDSNLFQRHDRLRHGHGSRLAAADPARRRSRASRSTSAARRPRSRGRPSRSCRRPPASRPTRARA